MYIKNNIFKISLSNNLDFISGNHNDRLIDTFDYFFSKKNLEKLFPDNFTYDFKYNGQLDKYWKTKNKNKLNKCLNKLYSSWEMSLQKRKIYIAKEISMDENNEDFINGLEKEYNEINRILNEIKNNKDNINYPNKLK